MGTLKTSPNLSHLDTTKNSKVGLQSLQIIYEHFWIKIYIDCCKGMCLKTIRRGRMFNSPRNKSDGLDSALARIFSSSYPFAFQTERGWNLPFKVVICRRTSQVEIVSCNNPLIFPQSRCPLAPLAKAASLKKLRTCQVHTAGLTANF